MSLIPDDKIREVRERASILEVVSDYVSLRKSGANYQGLCPFHGEKTPSFNVNPARGIFHCFGCGVGGNAITFIARMEGLSFPEAVKFLAKRVGVEIEDRPVSAAEKRRLDEREELHGIMELAVGLYREALERSEEGGAARRYLEGRGVDRATAEAYRLGFAPDRWDFLARHLQHRSVPLELAEKLGLVRRRDGGGFYDTFRNRLLFTITDIHGRAIGFGGRVLDDSLPKYINSPESPIYHKSEVLFGVSLAKGAMRETASAIVVEGYFDHLALFQAGVRNVVATCGTALTEGHIKLLKRYAGKAYTLFDADSAGRKATLRAMDLCLDAGFPAHVVELTAGEDPDSFIRKEGAEAFSARLAKARPVVDYFFRQLVRDEDTGTVEGKVKVIDEMAPRLARVSNAIERELYAREISRVLGVDVRSLARKIGGSSASVAPRDDRSAARPRRQQGASPEEMLLSLMGRYPEVAERVRNHGVARIFGPQLLPVAEAILERIGAGKPVEWGEILDLVEGAEERGRIAAFLVNDDHLADVDVHKAFDQCRAALERNSLGLMKELARELAATDPDSPRYRDLLAEIDALRNRKSQLS
ncbi:DNA primase [Geobacter hydrogenophilus]|uniref:DNA primase n=1 Tax=Geobacter hydrogenophilus TaxID=40983 RepID=A0A9W6G121_9BACT|nr:DNA primase [Geobacter hydrogenophilus]MBT0894280.1 DNA primase [Geobacter hydrogenophilus]GLI38433.1 DNA primase [Geobacter hydrogenophilus]